MRSLIPEWGLHVARPTTARVQAEEDGPQPRHIPKDQVGLGVFGTLVKSVESADSDFMCIFKEKTTKRENNVYSPFRKDV